MFKNGYKIIFIKEGKFNLKQFNISPLYSVLIAGGIVILTSSVFIMFSDQFVKWTGSREIEKLKWKLKEKYTTLGKYVSDNKISKSITDFSHDSNFLELANDVYKLKLYIEELKRELRKY